MIRNKYQNYPEFFPKFQTTSWSSQFCYAFNRKLVQFSKMGLTDLTANWEANSEIRTLALCYLDYIFQDFTQDIVILYMSIVKLLFCRSVHCNILEESFKQLPCLQINFTLVLIFFENFMNYRLSFKMIIKITTFFHSFVVLLRYSLYHMFFLGKHLLQDKRNVFVLSSSKRIES